MDLINYLTFLEPIQDKFEMTFSTLSGVLLVLFLLWMINFIVSLIQKTYLTGKAIGSFYRNYIHFSLKLIVVRIINLFAKSKVEASS